MTWKDRILNLYGTLVDTYNEQYDYPRVPTPQTQKQVTGRIDTSVNITLNNSGGGIASVGPQRVREWWSDLIVSVSAQYVSNEAQVNLYVGSTIISNTFLGTTPNGSHGATATLPNPITTGNQIWAVWTNGDPNVQATLRVQGTYSIGKPQ